VEGYDREEKNPGRADNPTRTIQVEAEWDDSRGEIGAPIGPIAPQLAARIDLFAHPW
jgi:hypothetical protein